MKNLFERYGITEYIMNDAYKQCVDIIEFARKNVDEIEASDRLKHKHHIVPKSMGGKDEKENVVKLYVADHVRIHYWLVYCTTGIFHDKMLPAFQRTFHTAHPDEVRDLDSFSSKFEEIFSMASEAASKRGRGKKNGPPSEETRIKISEAKKGKRPHPMTEETRRKIGASSKGRVNSPETRRKLSIANTGKKHGPRSPEHTRKIIEANTGRVVSEETRRKIAESNRGLKRSEETRKRISESAKLRWKRERAKNDS